MKNKNYKKKNDSSYLSTDMSNHQKVLANVKSKINEFSIFNFETNFLDENKLFDNQQIM